MVKLRKYMTNPFALFGYLGNRRLLNWLPDRFYLKLLYRGSMGQRLNLRDPQTLNEKLQWLKLHDRNPRYTALVDKYRVKEVVEKVLGSRAIVPTLGVWDSASNINFAQLPNEFVLKTNHNSGGVIICRDKHSFDAERAVASMNAQLRRSYFWPTREWPYRNVRPLVFAEKFVSNHQPEAFTKSAPNEPMGTIDYKFFCFHGEPKFLYVSQREDNQATAWSAMLTLEWSDTWFGRSDTPGYIELPVMPASFDRMIDAAKDLSKGIPFVRVDLFEVDGELLFSEMTFYPTTGMIPFIPQEADIQLGQLLHLEKVKVSG